MNNVSQPLEVVVLAAGQGTRMASRRPKVLHTLAGRTLLQHVLDTAGALEPARIHVVVGHAADAVRAAVVDEVNFVTQAEQRGTGHAVAQALPSVADDALVLVVYGDVPLVTASTLQACVGAAADGALALVTACPDDPGQLGRIVRDPNGAITGIVEYRDADEHERGIREINSGIMAAPRALLAPYLADLSADNAQGEYYLTDTVAMAVRDDVPVAGLAAADPGEVAGINDRIELAAAERRYQRKQVEALMMGGVTVADPARLDVRGVVTSGRDCFVDVNVVFEGEVVLGDGVCIGPGCVVRDAVIGDNTVLEPHTLVDGARVGSDCALGPFARLRPGTELAQQVRIGNFVETKKASLGPGSKANHLAYLGDASLGEACNVGAGTITCNYDGLGKHPTTIGDRVFVGSNATLVAPLELDSDAYVAAGSTVTQHVGAGDLAVGRGRQRNIHGWVRPDRRKSASQEPREG
ncbi:MAG: bifunctional UDP-N-acetylglucosamine diphosphorylase/glucosamine-1-phosphate N-acetyltransferase GlmU [Pseudomonadota bacterium]